MDAATWVRLSRLLDQALDLAPDERMKWVGALPADDEPLKPQVLALLAHTPSDTFLGGLPRIDDGLLDANDEELDKEDSSIGPYRLTRRLGEGGMGTVWLAERTDGMLRRPVALKLPRAWPRVALIRRMARERDILAGLTHPNIARLYDAGVTTTGRPYLALEYVEGKPIDEYCKDQRLDIGARLRVFLQVAHAVAYAHAKLVIHRDLKPSNILVTAEGDVRLLDFGIAKLLDTERGNATALTELPAGPHTPEYASPEQIVGEPLSVASDVYSLGVVLYELLTGTRPYKPRRESRAALEEAIIGSPIEPPSTTARDASMRRILRGDLDTIVLKALKKQPEERYETVNAFAGDIDRFVDGRPVLAQPDSRAYRLKKFVARNRMVTTAVAATLAAIVGGAGIATWQAREAMLQRNAAVREKVRADAEAELARRAARIARANADLTDYLMSDLAIGRSTTDLERQLERAIVTVRQQYPDDPLVRLRMLLAIAGRYRQLASFDRHRELVTELAAAAPAAGDQDTLAQLECWRARDLSQGGDAAGARALMDRVLADLQSRVPVPAEILISCLADDSAIARLGGDSRRAIASIEEVRRLEEAAGQARTDEHADTLLLLSRAYGQAGRYRDAERAAARSVALRDEIGRGDTTGMMNIRILHATMLRDGGRPDKALPLLEDEIAKHVARGGSAESIPVLEYEVGLTLIRLARAPEALPLLVRARAASRERGDATLVRATSVGRVLALTDTGRLAEAEAALKETEPLYARVRADRQYTARLFLFARTHLALARGDIKDANEALAEARALLDKLGNEGDPAWRFLHGYDARLAVRERRAADARRSAEAALRLAREHAIDADASLFVAEGLMTRADALRANGDDEAAREDDAAALGHFRAIGIQRAPVSPATRTLFDGRALSSRATERGSRWNP